MKNGNRLPTNLQALTALLHQGPYPNINQIEKCIHRAWLSKVARFQFRWNGLKSKKLINNYQQQQLALLRDQLRQQSTSSSLKMTPCPFYKTSSFQFLDSNITQAHLMATPSFLSGELLLQGWSSIIPPLALAPTPGSRCIDMCAAPGGKTVMLMELMQEQEEGGLLDSSSTVTAIDIHTDRFKNLQKLVAKCIPPTLLTQIQLANASATRAKFINSSTVSSSILHFDKPFDYVLLDAACSGEGLIRLHQPRTYKHWSLKFVRECATLQRKLLSAAHGILRPGGGEIVYSTCTLNSIENEENVAWFLDTFPDMDIVPLPKIFSADHDSDNGGVGGSGLHLVKEFHCGVDHARHKNMHHTLRVFPSESFDGFFVVKMRRR